MRDSLWNFNRFSLGKPCQKRLLSKQQLLMLIDLNMNPSPQDGFIVAQDRSFLQPRWSGKSGTSQIVSLEHAKASAALAASFKSASGKLSGFIPVEAGAHSVNRQTRNRQVIATNLREGFVTGSKSGQPLKALPESAPSFLHLHAPGDGNGKRSPLPYSGHESPSALAR